MSDNIQDKMQKIFDLESPTIPKSVGDILPVKEVTVDKEDVDKDYTTVRENLKDIVKRGTEAIDGIMLVASESQSPRAYEVVATLIKSVADANKDLLSLHKQIKEIKKTEVDNSSTTITNNSLFVGSTSELQKLLKGKMREIDETKIVDEQ
jgi:predicted  nucleic acid-binding Zn-ribbon protein